MSEPNDNFDFEIPTDWVCENYTAVDCNFVRDPYPPEGDSKFWKIDFLEPYEGDKFVVLSTNDFVPDPEHAKISQRVEFFAGQKFTGAYFFGTYDYLQWNDYALLELVPVDTSMRSIVLVHINVQDVSDHSCMEGWEEFAHFFSEEDEGVYDIEISVTDYLDEDLASYFAVDGLDICWPPDYGDVNLDCEVNLLDFSFLSHDWLLYDPNYNSTDPSDWRQYDTDFDGSHQVDANDLYLMSENWLYTK